MQYVSFNENGIIRTVADSLTKIKDQKIIRTVQRFDNSILGKKIVLGPRPNSLKVALICNWGDRCGISTYTTLLINSLKLHLSELKIFAEHLATVDEEQDKKDNVVRCWNRGHSMVDTIQQVKDWSPDIVFIQHEFGLFPKATHFLKMLELLNDTPYVITLHSVYEHLDKTICTSYIKNMIVHSQNAKNSLEAHGHLNNVNVIHHGCVEYSDHSELWNIFQNDYVVIQFGFGFNYKGVDCAIDAIKKLTEIDKYKNIFYCYMCSESPHTKTIQNDYYNRLNTKVQELNLGENVVIVRGFLSEQHICNFLRTAKLAIFPYKNDEKNIVYGASGAIRNAMANGIPIIASDCHLFDDLDGVVPRIANANELASEIDRIFSDSAYRHLLVRKNLEFITENTWEQVAKQHVQVFEKIIDENENNIVRVEKFEFV